MKTENIRPILAITMGDAAGIGPEIAVKSFSEKSLYEKCRPILMGNSSIIEKQIKLLGLSLVINSVSNVNDALFEYGTIDIFEHSVDGGTDDIKFGEISSKSGDLAFRCIVNAIELALSKQVDATVTGPIHKAAINAAGHHFSGHTEIYAHYTNAKKYGMLLADEQLKVIHVSTHVSLREAIDLVKQTRIIDVSKLLYDSLIQMGYKNPKIGIAGLNPHAGDNGLFGNEDTDEILPAVESLRSMGIDAEGPIPPDTLFALANGGKYDGCVAMYHDQGHIPFKVVGFQWDKEKGTMKSVKGVNITLGLPIIRTSVDHGTAFEVAGKGVASADALNIAIDYALKLSNYKNIK